MAQGRVEEAAKLADELAQRNPTSANLAARALTEIAQGRDEQAIASFQEALRISPNPLSTLYLADLETRAGRYRAAEGRYQAILAMGEGSATLYDHAALRGLARIARLQGRSDADSLYAKAEAVLRREVASGAFGHRRELAELLLERGRAQDVPGSRRGPGKTGRPSRCWPGRCSNRASTPRRRKRPREP
jgi:tetratricopeptide (TPR) repeat protein